MKADDLKKALKQHVSSAEWTDKDTWAVLNRVRKEKTRSGNSGVLIRALAVAAAFVIMFVGVLAGTGHLGLTGRPDHIQTTTEPIPLAQRKITPETELYYIPEIGEYYHLNSTCPAVSIQHKPMQAHFTFAEVNNEAYRGLQPCSACGAPMRPALPAETAEPAVTEIPAATAVPAAELPETGPDITEVPETNAPAKSSEALDLYKYAGFSDGTAKITKLLKDVENADIPAELNGYKVVSIGMNAFSNCNSLKTVTVPEGITTIEPSAFSGCENLASVTLPASLVKVEAYSFANCPSLESFSISPDNTVFAFENHALINKRDNSLVRFADPGSTGSYEIPGGIKRIETEAFAGAGLSSVTIPDTVTSIQAAAFMCCSNLTGIVIPEGVTEIQQQAFMSCSALESISLPNSLASIGPGVFSGCSSLTSIDISPDHPVYELSDLVLIDRNKKTVACASSAISGKYEVPGGIHNIRESAFHDCPRLAEVIIPDGVTSIGEYAFNACSGLKEITVPASVSYIGTEAFNTGSGVIVKGPAGSHVQQYCKDNGIRFEEIDSIPAAEEQVTPNERMLVIPEGTEAIRDRAYAGNDMTGVSIPGSVKTIGSLAFDSCTSLREVVIPEGVAELGNQVFMCCYELRSVSLPASVEKIGNGLFNYCQNLTSITVSPDNPRYEVQDLVLLDKETNTVLCASGAIKGPYDIPNGTEQIANYAFHCCYELEEITIPDSVTRIGANSFSQCGDLLVKGSAGSYAQQYCTQNRIRFEEIQFAPGSDSRYEYAVKEDGTAEITKAADTILNAVIPAELDGYKVTSIGDYVFGLDSNVQTVRIPEGVTSIASHAFFCCNKLTAVTLPDSLVSMEEAAIYSCRNLKNINISPDHPVLSFKNHTLVSKPDSTLIRFLDPGDTDSYEIPQGIKRIAASAFEHSSFRSVTIPDTVESIGNAAFDLCENLKEIVIPESISWIGSQAFFECSALESIRLPDSITSIGDGVFSGCRSLTSIEISPDHPVYEVKDLVLIDKKSMEIVSASAAISGKYEVPEGILSIENDAFQSCVSLTEVVIPESVSEIGNGAFNACDRLQQITVLGSSTEIWSGAFSTCNDNTVIKAPAGSTAQKYCEENGIRFEEIESGAADEQPASGNVCIVPDGTVEIPDNAYANNKMTRIIIPDSVKRIGFCAFDQCTELQEVTIPEGVTEIGGQVFMCCYKLESVSIPASAVSIGYGIFNHCGSLTSIDVSPDNPVYEAQNLLLINKESMSVVSGSGAIDGSCTIPDGIRLIQDLAFQGCYDMTELTIPDSVIWIGEGAFNMCNNLTVCASAGSAAEKYCRQYGIRFMDSASGTVAEYRTLRQETLTVLENTDGLPANKQGTYEYKVKSDGTAHITKANRSIKDGNIPAELDGYKVTSIGENAFSKCELLTSVVVPDTVTYIGDQAFEYTENLETIFLPDSLTAIGDQVFFFSGLKSIRIPAGLTSIGDSCFGWCENLKTIEVDPANPVFEMRGSLLIKKDENKLFFHLNTDQGKFEVPDDIEIIGKSAFFLSTGLKEVIIPDSVKEICESAFFRCHYLQSVRLPDGLKVVDDTVFSHCIGLRSITIPDSVEAISSYAFYCCDKLAEIIIPASVTSIGNEAFEDCGSLTVKAPAGSYAQKYCERKGIPFVELNN